MLKRIALFLAVNCLVVLTISTVLSLLNVKPYLTSYGLDLRALSIFCLIWGFSGALISLVLSRKTAKWMLRIRSISPNGPQAELYHMVARLARAANLPEVPEVGIFDSSQMNAFATGPTKRRSLIAVSTGLLAKMEKHQLEAVLGHEISHISNGDMVTMTLIQGVVNAFVMFLARVLAYAVTGMGRSDNRRPSHTSYYLFTILFECVFMILGSMVVCIFSRSREFRADRGGAILTRKEHMVAALEKLRLDHAPPSDTKSALNTLMISTRGKRGILKLFTTHPPLETRIRRLREM
ncbi:MAG: protease HtpX [Chlamydiota bacterium]